MSLGATYEVWACDPFGVRVADLSNFTQLKYARVVNDWSTATITLPPGFDPRVLRIPDGRIEIWRNGVLVTETIWLLKVIRPKRDQAGNVTIEIETDTPLGILRAPGRFNNIYADPYLLSLAGDPIVNTAGGIINTLWHHACGSNTSTTADFLGPGGRDIHAYIGVDNTGVAGPTLTLDVKNRAVLDAMRDAAQASAQQGSYIAFDIVADVRGTLTFRMFGQQRGIDHRFPTGNNPVILSPDFGTLAETTLEINYRDEVTAAWALGRGEGLARQTTVRYDSTRMAASPFGLRELAVTVNSTNSSAALQSAADAAVRAGRPLVTLTGKIVNTPGCQFGVHWNWGDYVTMTDFGYSFDARIDAIAVTVDDTAQGPFETIDATLRAETYL